MFKLEVVLTKRDTNRLVREYGYTEVVPSLDVATSTADALIARMAAHEDHERTTYTRGGSTHFVFWAEGNIVGFGNVNEIH